MAQGIAQLSAAMAAGDAVAVEAFYRDYFDWMYAHARRITRRDESFCLDVVQDATLRVIRTVKRVDAEPRFRGWLKLVVQTTAFDLLRNERRRKNREALAGAADVGNEVDALQLDSLAEQISRLDPEIVRIIELRFEQAWTLRKIGEKLGLSVSAVDGRLRRALTHLRLSVESDDGPKWMPATQLVVEPKGAEATVPTIERLSTVRPAPLPEMVEPAKASEIASELVSEIVVDSAPAIEQAEVATPAPSALASHDTARTAMMNEPAEAPAAISLVPSPIWADTNEAHVAARSITLEKIELPVVLLPRETKSVVVAEMVADDLEFVGLEDEAGAYDDKL
jgi:RNA polymerase sigma factor (sigma-70 family)